MFKVNTDGTGFTNLCTVASYMNPDLVLSANTLYGTTGQGGSSGYGTVFKVNTDGTGFTTLYTFTRGDEANPSGLLLSGGVLYGTTTDCCGSEVGYGTVFSLGTDGTGFTTLYRFSGGDGDQPLDMILSGSTLYGTTYYGGNTGNGTVFAINTDGTGFASLYNFSANLGQTGTFYGTIGDGACPGGVLALSGNTLYGTARFGGAAGNGTIFSVNTDGTGFTNLHDFTASDPVTGANSDGVNPSGRFILSGNTLYGTTETGGKSRGGTIFSLSLQQGSAPQLSLTPSGPNVILTWPTNATGFTLQSTTDLGSSALWTTNTPAPVIVNDQNVVTIPISGTQMFFRLSQ